MTRRSHITALAAGIASILLLGGCGGGGGGGGMVRSDPPPPAPPTPPPAAAAPCPAPVSADCMVSASGDMTGGRDSDHGLRVDGGTTHLALHDGTYRFAGGTTVDGGSTLELRSDATLASTLEVESPAVALLYGTVVGDVVNHGAVFAWGTVDGDLANHGQLTVGSSIYGDESLHDRITGDFVQAATGSLHVALPPEGWTDPTVGMLQVDGRAELDGTLNITQYADAWGPFPLPVAPLSVPVLHADGGVSGAFADWSPLGLFLEGTVRYGSHDVWFDLTRAELESTMAAHAGDALTLASAANIDAALRAADAVAFAPAASLDPAQRRFLASAASLLWTRDAATATRALDSLSGHAHVRANGMLHGRGAALAADLGERLPSRAIATDGAWASSLREPAAGGPSLSGRVQGMDRWIGPRWLVGGGLLLQDDAQPVERLGGTLHGEAPASMAYAHYRGQAWQATGLLGAGRTRMQVERPLELGGAGRHLAVSDRRIDQAFAHLEVARPLLRGHLVPYVALDWSALQWDGFVEQGDTGFELAVAPGQASRWTGLLGARWRQHWPAGVAGRLGLRVDAGVRRDFADAAAPLQAAFTGTPQAPFALRDFDAGGTNGWLSVGLDGGLGRHWTWSANYARGFGPGALDTGWAVRWERAF